MAGNGFSDLGALLGGGNALAQENAYSRGQLAAATLDQRLMEARKARDAEIGRSAAAQRAYDSGDNELGDAIMQGFGSLPGLTTYKGGVQHRGLVDEAAGIARNPNGDLGELNRMLMVVHGQPEDLTKIQDHTLINPMVTPDHQTPTTTELGQAMVGTQHSLAAEHDAQAGTARARTGKIEYETPHPPTDNEMAGLLAHANEIANGNGGGHQNEADAWLASQFDPTGMYRGTTQKTGHGDAVKPTALTSAQLKAMFGKDDGGIDGEAYRAFLGYQHQKAATDPRYRDASFAAQAYAQDMHNIDGGSTTTAPVGGAPVAAHEPSLMDTIKGAVGIGGGDPHGPVNPATQHTAADAAKPSSQAEFDALPSGTLFVNPADGRLMRKK